MLFHAVVIDRAVAVVVGHRLAAVALLLIEPVVVVIPRVQPDCGDSQIPQIRCMVQHAPQVAAVVEAWIGAVQQALRNGRIVVGWIAVGEAVGHDQVEEVGRREALHLPGAVGRIQHFEVDVLRAAAGECEMQPVFARSGHGRDGQVREEVGSTLAGCEVSGAERGLRYELRLPQVAAVHQQANGRPGAAHPPRRRLQFVHPRLRAQSADRRQAKQEGEERNSPQHVEDSTRDRTCADTG